MIRKNIGENIRRDINNGIIIDVEYATIVLNGRYFVFGVGLQLESCGHTLFNYTSVVTF
ncbi:MAG: hypothetical protein MOIL_00337 [Candidatus Methanolliviera sp. GoM_oil]|nr:MAG: hypothetical protein MOIL_00337 [Candidatus Methanolliviera sp. GoM_oil]